MRILQIDKVTGTCNESDRTCVQRRIREKVKIDAMQFGFMSAKGTTDAIFSTADAREIFFPNLQKRCRAFFHLHPYFSCICRTVKIASVVPFPGINPNCIASILTFSLILLSNTRSITFIACSSNFIAL